MVISYPFDTPADDYARVFRNVRAWLRTLPGMIEGESDADVLRKTLLVFNGEGAQGEMQGHFAQALRVSGYEPQHRGARWILALPERAGQ